MKHTISFWISFTILTCLTGFLRAQAPLNLSQKTATVFQKDTVAQLIRFTGKYAEGKTYLHWSVANQHVDGIYVVYRSLDNVSYTVLGQKQGIGVPISAPIAYYFQDPYPYAGTTYYKLIHFSQDATCLTSDVLEVTMGSAILSRTK